MAFEILPASMLVGLAPQVAIDAYGLKVQGYAALIEAQPESPISYEVPEAFAIPNRLHGGYAERDVHDVFEKLTDGLNQPSVLMARSSASDEEPGQNESRMVAFRPTDRPASARRFAEAVDQVLQASGRMGVLASRMVGEYGVLPGNREGFGFRNISFVADSHSAFKQGEMNFAFVHGLGTRAVEAGDEAILVTTDRKTGKITHFGNKSEGMMLESTGSTQVAMHCGHYRQQEFDYFDFETDGVATLKFNQTLFELLRGAILGIDFRNDRMVNLVSQHHDALLCLTPFERAEMFYDLVGILNYLEGKIGPVQIEGARLHAASSQIYLYQSLPVPLLAVDPKPIEIKNPVWKSDKVIGRGDIRAPLVWWDSSVAYIGAEESKALQEMDKRFADSDYILLAKLHPQKLIANTPHARWRLSFLTENASSHAATLARLYINGGDNDILGMNAEDCLRNKKPPPDFRRGPFHVWNKAHLESNGAELAVEVKAKRISWVKHLLGIS